jgi:hypothetical protein
MKAPFAVLKKYFDIILDSFTEKKILSKDFNIIYKSYI